MKGVRVFKFFLVVLFSLLLIGCQDSKSNSLSKTNNAGPWSDLSTSVTNLRKLTLDEKSFKVSLDNSSILNMSSVSKRNISDEISIPLPDGSYINVSVSDDPLETPDYKADFKPEVWNVTSKDKRISGGTLVRNISGFNMMLLMSDSNTIYIEPKEEEGKGRYYISYDNKHIEQHPINCSVKHATTASLGNKLAKRFVSNLTNHSKRIYRFAPVATYAFHRKWGWDSRRRAFNVGTTWNFMYNLLVQARLVIRRDTSVDFEMAGAPQTNVITTQDADFSLTATVDTSGNPVYTHLANSIDIMNANQNFLDRYVGTLRYDIGHVFDDDGTNQGGGVAVVGVACDSRNKAKGYSNWNGSRNNFSLSVLAHEIGHQLNAHHTYSSPLCIAPNDTFDSESAVEPGSGTTIMGYPQVCSGDNLASVNPNVDVDRMYHSKSIEDIHDYVFQGFGSNCGRLAEPNGNPQVDLDPFRANHLVIPARTPFILDGALVRDPTRQRTFYSWEQIYPSRPRAASRLNADTGDNAIIRAHLPTWTTKRIVPSLAALVAGRRIDGEVAPIQSRPRLRFRFVARDNFGGVGYDDVDIRIVDTGEPFRIFQPNRTHIGAGLLTVRWSVARTNLPPISCANVEISASQNNGRLFTTLIRETVNDGVETVNIPAWLATDQTRIRVKCSTDIFFAMSATNPGLYTATSSR